MSEETLITLPDAETMMARLKEVSDEKHYIEKFYPLLTKQAGQERVPIGIVMMLQLTIYEYTKGLPRIIVAMLNMNMERYIDALVLDESAAAQVKAHWAEVQRRARAG